MLSAPITWVMIIPLVIMDISLEIYHNVCFRLLGIPLVKRKNYIRVDRHKLSYLDLFDKINCAYCGYGNGLIHYATIIAGKSEEYWCGIKHKKYKGFIEPKHHKDFAGYGDEEEHKEKISKGCKSGLS